MDQFLSLPTWNDKGSGSEYVKDSAGIWAKPQLSYVFSGPVRVLPAKNSAECKLQNEKWKKYNPYRQTTVCWLPEGKGGGRR